MSQGRTSLSARARFTILERDRFQCRYCGRGPDAVQLEVDHVVPISAGGTNDPSNLVTACKPCNRGKSALRGVMHPDSAQRLRDVEEEIANGSAAAEWIYCDPYVTSLVGEPVV